MRREEWATIVAKLNLSWPRQQISRETAEEWFTELADRPAERVWEAVRRCRREQSFAPSLAELLDAMALNARERAAATRALPAPDRRGVPAPPEAKRVLGALRRGLAVLDGDEEPPTPTPRSREQQLAELEAMAAQDPPDPPAGQHADQPDEATA